MLCSQMKDKRWNLDLADEKMSDTVHRSQLHIGLLSGRQTYSGDQN